jgi:hypothetical protein
MIESGPRISGDFHELTPLVFSGCPLLSALASLAGDEAFAQAQAQQHDPKLANFWDAYFDEAERDPTHVSRGSNDADLLDPARRVQLIHATDSGLIYPDGIDAKQLLPDPDVVVTLNPSHFRPAADDTKAIARSKGCQIRLDCIQTRPIMNLIAPMAWAGLAAWSLDKTAYSASKVSDLNTNPVIDPKTGKQKIAIKASPGPAAPQLKDLDFVRPERARHSRTQPGDSARRGRSARTERQGRQHKQQAAERAG